MANRLRIGRPEMSGCIPYHGEIFLSLNAPILALPQKVKQSHYRAWTGPEGSRFQDNRHMKVVGLPALHTGRLYPQEVFLVLISVRRSVDSGAIERPEGLLYQ